MDETSRDARERWPGWMWITFGGTLLVLLPLWLILTAAVLQLTHEEWFVDRPWLEVWILGGLEGGVALLVLLGVVGVLTVFGWIGGRLVSARQHRARAMLDAVVDPEAALPETTLRTGTVETYDPRRDDTG
jgi:succinate dehydrogenase hydrophobic anchor subunit